MEHCKSMERHSPNNNDTHEAVCFNQSAVNFNQSWSGFASTNPQTIILGITYYQRHDFQMKMNTVSNFEDSCISKEKDY